MATPTAQQMLDAYLQAELDVLAGKRVRFNDGNTEKWLDSEDLEWIIAGRKQWQAAVAGETAAASGAPRFGGLSYSVARMDGH
jgi:hypothetical protein